MRELLGCLQSYSGWDVDVKVADHASLMQACLAIGVSQCSWFLVRIATKKVSSESCRQAGVSSCKCWVPQADVSLCRRVAEMAARLGAAPRLAQIKMHSGLLQLLHWQDACCVYEQNLVCSGPRG
jgi:hypothetical protein